LNYRRKEEVANTLRFWTLCQRFESTLVTGDKRKKSRLLFPEETITNLIGHSPYPIVRLIVPEVDTGRPVYNCKQKSIASFYIKMLQFAKSAPDAERLKNWRDPSRGGMNSANSRQAAGAKSAYGARLGKMGRATAGVASSNPLASSGEFADVLYDVLRLRVRSDNDPSDQTVGDVNELLNRLANASNDQERLRVFEVFKKSFCATEQKWLVRIIIRDLKIGVRHEGLLKEFHPKALECYCACCDLRKVNNHTHTHTHTHAHTCVFQISPSKI
jgi:DNA ligase-4